MGWITLSCDTGHTLTQKNDLELVILGYNRQKRGLQRTLSVEKARVNKNKKEELRIAKQDLNEKRAEKPTKTKKKNGKETLDTSSSEYQAWQSAYNELKSQYEEDKAEIEDYYEGYLSEIEEESTSDENFIDDQLTLYQAALEAINSQNEVTKEQTSTDISSTKINLK